MASASPMIGLPGRVPAELAAEAQREVGQVAGRGDAMAALEVGDRLAARLDAVEEVAGVAAELVELVPGLVLDRLGPGPRRADRRLAVGAADGVARRTAGRRSTAATSGSGVDREAAARDRRASPSCRRTRGRAAGGVAARRLAVRPGGGPARDTRTWRPACRASRRCPPGRTARRSWRRPSARSRPRNQSTMSSECWPRLVICPPE